MSFEPQESSVKALSAKFAFPAPKAYYISDLDGETVILKHSLADADDTADENPSDPNNIESDKPSNPEKVIRFPQNHRLHFKDLNNCKLTIASNCVKVLVENCTNCEFTLSGRVITQMLDVWRSEGLVFKVGTEMFTVQVDMCHGIGFEFGKRDYFKMIAWSLCKQIHIRFDGEEAESAQGTFGLPEKDIEPSEDQANQPTTAVTGPQPTVDSNISSTNTESTPNTASSDKAEEDDQYVIKFSRNVLISAKVMRIAGGYASTQFENREFLKRRDANMEIMKKRMTGLADAFLGEARKKRNMGARTMGSTRPGSAGPSAGSGPASSSSSSSTATTRASSGTIPPTKEPSSESK